MDKDIFDPTGLSYKDICIMAKNLPINYRWPYERDSDDEDQELYAAIDKFAEMFIADNPSGYKMWTTNVYEEGGKVHLSVGLVKEFSNGTKKHTASVFSFEKDFLDALYIDRQE